MKKNLKILLGMISFVLLALSLTIPGKLSCEISSESWANQFIQENGISSQSNASNQLFSVVLPIDQPGHYSSLQRKIAEFIPRESQRPVISLYMNGKLSYGDTNSCAILGGMGPLSDARILNLIVTKLKEKNLLDLCRIHLLSAPPPRSFWEIMLHSCSYLANLYEFLNADHHQVYLASNTAHLYFDWIDRLGKKNLVNLTHYVADIAKICTDHPHVLIVGTKAGTKKNLYGKLFEERAVNYIYLSEELQEIVQEEIGKAKEGQGNGDRLCELICCAVRENSINVLLLGCTELPIVLEDKKDELNALGIVILDSEQIFAEKICIDIEQTLNKKTAE